MSCFKGIYYCWIHKKSYFPIYLDYLVRGNDNKAINMKQILYSHICEGEYPGVKMTFHELITI